MTEKKGLEELNIRDLASVDENRVKEIFDDDYQNKFIKVFMENTEFYEQIFDIIVPGYFHKYQKELIDKIIKYVVKNNGRPDYNDLKRQIRIDEKVEKHKEHLIHLVDKVMGTEMKSEAPIKDNALLYFKKQAMANALYEAAAKWDEDDFDSIMAPLNEAMKAGQSKSGSLSYAKDIKSTLSDDFRNPISTVPEIDILTGGGLSAGELAILMAPTGGGKSMGLVVLAANAYLNGHSVMYFTLELGAKYVARRFHACLNDIHQAFLKYYPEVIEERALSIEKAGGKLEIQKFGTRTATVQTLKNSLISLERDTGFKPDIVFIDYADLLKPEEVNKEHRITLQILYQTIRGMGDEMGFPIWSATQTNREGSKGDKVGMDTIADSYGKAAEVDLLCSIGKDDVDRPMNFNPEDVVAVTQPNAQWGFLKNRLGPDGFFLPAILDTSRVFLKVFDNSSNGTQKPKSEQKKPRNKREKSESYENTSEDLEMQRLEESSEDEIGAMMKGS